MKWRSIAGSPPPEGLLVWVTDWRSFALAKRVTVSEGRKKVARWCYRSLLIHGAEAWCTREEFETAVFPEGREAAL